MEYSYPPLVPGTDEESGEVPVEWKHLPTLALPDGAHNYSKGSSAKNLFLWLFNNVTGLHLCTTNAQCPRYHSNFWV